MARRNDHSREEIRQMALIAAETVLAKEGPKGLTARKIASAIGYTAGTLYLVFESLEDLALQINGRTLDALYEWLRARSEPTDDPVDSLMSLAEAYIAYAEAETQRWHLLFEFSAYDEKDLPEWYLSKLSRVFGLAETALKPMARHRSGADIQQAARVLWASVHGICTLKIGRRLDLVGGKSTSQIVRVLIENFLRGFERQKKVE